MRSEDRERIGREIAALRQARAWSQATLAEAADVSLRSVQRAEGGRCRSETLAALAGALDADVRDLLRSSGLAPEDVTAKAGAAPIPTGPTMLSRLPTGKALLDLVAKAVAWQFDHDALERDEVEVVANLVQATQGFACVFGDLQPGERVRASAVLQEHLLAAEAKGLIILGAVESRPLFLRPGRPVPRPVAVVVVSRRTDPPAKGSLRTHGAKQPRSGRGASAKGT